MSWSVSITNQTPAKAIELLNGQTMPDSIKAYFKAGIDALETRHGEDVLIDATGYGHLCDSPTSYDVTSASITVKVNAVYAANPSGSVKTLDVPKGEG